MTTLESVDVRPRRPRQLRLVRARAVPVLRWAGGKTSLLDEIVPLLPRAYGTYFEPFCGGASLFFRLSPRVAVISDWCQPLVESYQQIALDPVGVHRELGDVVRSFPLSSYGEARALWNDHRAAWTPRRRAAFFLYLNKSCFNGLWRVNRSGRFNVPVGRFSASGPSYSTQADLVAAGAALSVADVRCRDYRDALASVRSGDLVYLDPPYLPASETANFSSYQAERFDLAAHQDLAVAAGDLARRGAHVVVSQADSPWVREAYAGFRVHEVSARRSVAARGSSRGRTPEVVLCGGPVASP